MFLEFYMKANEVNEKKSITFSGLFVMSFRPDRFGESLIFCSIISSFCSLQQVTQMFFFINLSKAEVKGLSV